MKTEIAFILDRSGSMDSMTDTLEESCKKQGVRTVVADIQRSLPLLSDRYPLSQPIQ